MRYKLILLIMLFFAWHLTCIAQDKVIKIWPDLAPGSSGVVDNEKRDEGGSVSAVYQPDLTIFLAKESASAAPAVVIFPGGGYQKIVMNKEGYKIAHWLNEHGISAFVLKYRLERKYALRDAQRAISMIRDNAEKYQIDKDKIGVIGFSAGAHLAANLVMNHQDRQSYDKVDAASSRPDFWVGVYGRYSDIYGKGNDFGKRENVSPSFLVHAANDSKVPFQSSIDLYKVLVENGVSAELHVYEEGEHGFALERNRGTAITSTVDDWSKRMLEWVKIKGFYK